MRPGELIAERELRPKLVAAHDRLVLLTKPDISNGELREFITLLDEFDRISAEIAKLTEQRSPQPTALMQAWKLIRVLAMERFGMYQ